jgi:hypothetical protein
MFLGTLAFLSLLGSAFLGGVVLVAGLVLAVTKTWRRAGLLALAAGLLGALPGVGILLALEFLLGVAHSPLGVWLLFAAAGFGWLGLLSLAMFVAVVVFGRPTRWADRRREANA